MADVNWVLIKLRRCTSSINHNRWQTQSMRVGGTAAPVYFLWRHLVNIAWIAACTARLVTTLVHCSHWYEAGWVDMVTVKARWVWIEVRTQTVYFRRDKRRAASSLIEGFFAFSIPARLGTHVEVYTHLWTRPTLGFLDGWCKRHAKPSFYFARI